LTGFLRSALTGPEIAHGAGTSHDDRRRDRAVFVGVLLVSLSVLLLQVALTRLFSFTIWYHFAYVTISVALLGYGASGALLAVAPGLAGRDPLIRLAQASVAAGLATLVALVVIAKVPFHPFQLRKEPWPQIPYMAVSYGAVAAPFFLAGFAVSLALRTLAHRVSRLYFFDLGGAALGCLLVTPAIWLLSTPGAVCLAAAGSALGGVAFAAGAGRRPLAIALAAAALVGVAAAATGPRLRFLPSP